MLLHTKRRTSLVSILVSCLAGTAVADVNVELVALTSPGAMDQVGALPVSETVFPLGGTFFVEIWAQTTDPNGLAQVTLDMLYDAPELSAVQVTHTTLFNLFPCGDPADMCGGIDNIVGEIDNISGSNLSGLCANQAGATPNWARVAIVEMVSTADVFANIQSIDANGGTLVVANCGSFDPPVVTFGSLFLQIGEPVPTVSQWGLMVMMLLLLVGGTLVFGRSALAPRTGHTAS